MKKAVSFLVAAAMVAQGVGTAWACGRHRCEAPCDYVGGGDCGGCGYTLQYKTEYRPVTRTVYKMVPETTQQQITENIVTPVTREEERERTDLRADHARGDAAADRVQGRVPQRGARRDRDGPHDQGSRATSSWSASRRRTWRPGSGPGWSRS